MSIQNMIDLDLSGKRVLIRQDLNVPVKNGQVTSDIRIQASIPTIQKALAAGAAVMVLSHLGRPVEGEYDSASSLKPVADRLSTLLGKPVRLEKDWLNGIDIMPGEVVLCENVRFNIGEEKNSDELGKKMAALCDVFVMDAFGTAHRAQASTHSVAKYAPVACAGPLLASELDALGKALKTPVKPLVAIVGGSKVSTKLTVLKSLSEKVDQLIVGGGIANTFIAAAGFPVGKSLYEADLIEEAQRLIAAAKKAGSDIPIPVDVVCAKEFSDTAIATIKKVQDVDADDLLKSSNLPVLLFGMALSVFLRLNSLVMAHNQWQKRLPKALLFQLLEVAIPWRLLTNMVLTIKFHILQLVAELFLSFSKAKNYLL